MALWETIANTISDSRGEPFTISAPHAVGGGCINSTYRVADDGRSYFVKLNDADSLDMFEAEADGLREMAKANAIKVPEPIATGMADSQAFIVLENLDLGGAGSGARLGLELAALHRTRGLHYGWYRNNTIGSTRQYNAYSDDWVDFWDEQRLGVQLRLASIRGVNISLLRKGERLRADLPAFFESYTPSISLLHGDLWSGNYAFCRDGTPVLFDPAVYYGDREADIAMTELFGGFGRDFYDAYNEAWPLDAGYEQRKILYNLYHILNHYNLFGGGYAGQAEAMIERLLAELHA